MSLRTKLETAQAPDSLPNQCDQARPSQRVSVTSFTVMSDVEQLKDSRLFETILANCSTYIYFPGHRDRREELVDERLREHTDPEREEGKS